MVGVLSDRQIQRLCDAIVAEGFGRPLANKRANVINYEHDTGAREWTGNCFKK